MSLDISLLVVKETVIYAANYTHNVVAMASQAGLYEVVWRPDEHGYTHARDIIPILRSGIKAMKADPDRFKALNPENGWGSYDSFMPWLERYLEACEGNPEARIEVSR